MPEQLFLTRILNQVFAGPVTVLLNWLQSTLHVPVAPRYPDAPITNAVAMELLVFGFLIIVFLLVRSRLSVENPGPLQQIFEGVNGFVENQSSEVIGHHSEGFTPFLVALGFFILISNLLGLIP